MTAAQKLGCRTSSNSGFFMLDLEALPPEQQYGPKYSQGVPINERTSDAWIEKGLWHV